MNSVLRSLLLGSIVAVSFFAVTPRSVKADDYWNNHWRWYDNTYRPYYYRQYYSNPGYYGQGYNYGQGYYNRGYTYGTPYREYYGTPGVGYGRTYGGRQAVNVGPFSFGWR